MTQSQQLLDDGVATKAYTRWIAIIIPLQKEKGETYRVEILPLNRTASFLFVSNEALAPNNIFLMSS